MLATALAAGGLAVGTVHAAAPPPAADSAPSQVLAPTSLSGSALPTGTGLRAALSKPLSGAAFGGAVRVSVLDPATGAQMYEAGASTPATPASTVKILTAAAVLVGYGADGHIATTVTQATPDEIVLVGGGDPLLQVEPSREEHRASLSELASRTAAALKAASPGTQPSVRLRYDDSLFSGPTKASNWEPSYTKASGALVPPITALMANEGFIGGDVDTIPAAEASKAFAGRLRAAGVKVKGKPTRSVSSPDAKPLAQVFSAPMSMLVSHMLKRSDNISAEMLGHLAGGRLVGSYSFAGGVEATKKVLDSLGIPTAGVVLYDASGLSRANLVPPITLTKALAAATTNATPELWPIIPGLAVAGFDGTLSYRFTAPSAAKGRGYVRAKTGSLSGVASLAGTVVDVDGATLIFAFMAPNASDIWAAGQGFDRAAAALASCGCR